MLSDQRPTEEDRNRQMNVPSMLPSRKVALDSFLLFSVSLLDDDKEKDQKPTPKKKEYASLYILISC